MCFVSVARTVISDVSAIPHDDRSLLVQWRRLASSSPRDFVVQWRPLLNADISLTQFEITDRNQTSLVIKGMFYTVFITGPSASYLPSYFACCLFLLFPARPACTHC